MSLATECSVSDNQISYVCKSPIVLFSLSSWLGEILHKLTFLGLARSFVFINSPLRPAASSIGIDRTHQAFDRAMY